MRGSPAGSTEIGPVCDTALGVVDVRSTAAANPRVHSSLVGTEGLAHDLCTERSPEAVELDHERRRFVLECREAGIEPIDAPCTFSDSEGAARETRHARRLGYHSKAVVLPDHAGAINAL